jgi:glycosyltransferase involved in cell wall biosynthesis
MRIGIDYTAGARQGGGIGRYTRELVRAFLGLGGLHDYTIFAAIGGLQSGDWRLETQNLQSLVPGLRFRTLPLSDDWLHRLWQRLRLPLPVELITGPLDVFYSPDFVLPPTLRATRTLLTVHDLSFLHYPDAYVPSLRRYLERAVPRSVARADRLLADSKATRADLIAYYGAAPDKIDVLYCGVDPRFGPDSNPGERVRLQDRYGIDDRPYVLTVGTLQPRKNFARLIEAFVSLAADVQLLIAGGRGWLCEDILAKAAEHRDRVRLLGFVDDADLPALYRNAELFSLPSLYEGFGLPVLEAMACGTPVVCSGVSSLPEVAGDAASMIDPFDVDGLAAAIARVLQEAAVRRNMAARGLEQAKRFTWEQVAQQLLRVLDSLHA